MRCRSRPRRRRRRERSAGEQLLDADELRQLGGAQPGDLDGQGAGLGAAHHGFARQQLIHQPQQVLVAAAASQRGQRLSLFEDQIDLRRIGAEREMERIAAVGEELAEDVARVPPLVLDMADLAGHADGIALQDGLEQAPEERDVEAAQQTHGGLVGDGAGAEGGELVEQRHGVADAAFTGSRHQPQRAVAGLDGLGVADLPQQRRHRGRRDAPELELLAAREDGGGDRLDLGGREDEHQVRRRLLDDLEQGVEGLAREAVDLVEHDHLVAVARRAVLEALGQLANLLDLGVGGGINLDDVEIGAARDLDAGDALVAGIGSRPALAVERLGEHPRRGRLADAADAGKEVGLCDAPLLQRVAQRGHDRFLTDETGEILGAPLAG